MTMDPFYPIFDDIHWLERALPLGVTFVQMRIKDKDSATTKSMLQDALKICTKYEAILVVNDYWETAIEIGANWCHLGQEDLDTADIPGLRKANINLGISTHDETELQRALALEPQYVALGPIWPTILKKMKWAPQGVKKISKWKSYVGNIPLVAIGGMTPERALEARQAGADIISVVTDITMHEQPEKRIQEWRAQLS